MGKLLILIGFVLVIVGVIITFNDRLPFGKLPGDFVAERGNMKVYFPLTTCILVSLILSLVLYIINRWRNG